MPCTSYTTINFSAASVVKIKQANDIIDEYQAQGFDLTLRQLYYQFVARGFIPNSVQEYKKLGALVNDGRLAGEIDWNAIVDRTRNLEENVHWESPGEIVRSCADNFMLDRWRDQPCYIEVWIEKEALSGIIEKVCRPLDLPYFSCRGYVSQSEMWGASQRFLNRFWGDDKQTIVLHLGDHDPSGMDMTRDIQDRISLFVRGEGEGVSDVFTLERIALNSDQVKQYNPPPNPAKVTDSRYEQYSKKFGYKSWELDALDPAVLRDLIRDAVSLHWDSAAWAATTVLEKQHVATLRQIADNLTEE